MFDFETGGLGEFCGLLAVSLAFVTGQSSAMFLTRAMIDHDTGFAFPVKAEEVSV